MKHAARSELKAQRVAAGLSQEQLAETIGASLSTVASWEQGRATPRAGKRTQLAAALGITVDDLDRILTGRATTRGGWRFDAGAWLRPYAETEARARMMWVLELLVVPAVLQTPAYAEAVETAAIPTPTPDELVQRVARRVDRARVLDDPDHCEFWALIPERVLFETVGGTDVMADQMGHLATLAARPNVTLQVIPSDGRVTAAVSAFTVLGDEPGRPGVAFTFDAVAGTPHYDPYRIGAFVELFPALAAGAIDPVATINLIHQTRHHYATHHRNTAHVA